MIFIHETIDVFGFLLYQTVIWSYWFSLIIVPLVLPLYGIDLIKKSKKVWVIPGKIFFIFSFFIAVLWLFPVARFNVFWVVQILERQPLEKCDFNNELLNWCFGILGSLVACYLGMFILGFKSLILKVFGWVSLILGIWCYAYTLIVRILVGVDSAL